MKITLIVVGSLFGLVGIVWFLQGIGLLQGSLMTSQTQWIVIGGIVFLVGVALLVLGIRWKAVERSG